MAHTCRISSQKTLSYREVSKFMGSFNWASGLIPLGHLHLRPLQHFHSLGLKTVFQHPAFRPCSSCYPTQAVADPIVSHIRNPYLTFPGGVYHFHRCLDPGLGRPHGGFSDCGCMVPFRTRAPHQCTGAQGGNIGPQSLGYSIAGPSCFDCFAADNTTVVAYINKQGGTHSHLLLRLVVDLFLWLQTQDITQDITKSQTHSGLPKCDSRPLVSAEPAHHDRVESPPRSRESDIQTVGNSSSGQVCHSPQHASSPVHGSSSGASSTGDRCFVTGLAGEVNVHVSTVSPAQPCHSEAQDHQDGRGDTHRPLVAVTTVLSTPATIECGSPATILSVPQRPFVTTGLYLKRQVIPSAWRLLCSTTKQQDFQGRCLSLPQLLHVGDPPQIECMMTGCYASLPGLQGEDLIRLSRVTGPV